MQNAWPFCYVIELLFMDHYSGVFFGEKIRNPVKVNNWHIPPKRNAGLPVPDPPKMAVVRTGEITPQKNPPRVSADMTIEK